VKTVETLPFLTAAPERLSSEGWLLIAEEFSGPLPEKWTNLDDMSILTIRRDVLVDVDSLRIDCGLRPETGLALTASWGSTGTYIKRQLSSVSLPSSGHAVALRLAGEIPVCDVGSTLTIETKIILASSGDSGDALSATFAGSVLWLDRAKVFLDEADAFFPMQLSPFDEGSLLTEPLAGWRLLWMTNDFDRPFLGNVTLLINSLHPSVSRAVAGHVSVQSRSHAIRQAVYFDVARELILRALRQHDFVERDGDYGEGTCGGVVTDLLRYIFPAEKLSSLSGMAETTPELFSSVLQARLAVFEGA